MRLCKSCPVTASVILVSLWAASCSGQRSGSNLNASITMQPLRAIALGSELKFNSRIGQGEERYYQDGAFLAAGIGLDSAKPYCTVTGLVVPIIPDPNLTFDRPYLSHNLKVVAIEGGFLNDADETLVRTHTKITVESVEGFLGMITCFQQYITPTFQGVINPTNLQGIPERPHLPYEPTLEILESSLDEHLEWTNLSLTSVPPPADGWGAFDASHVRPSMVVRFEQNLPTVSPENDIFHWHFQNGAHVEVPNYEKPYCVVMQEDKGTGILAVQNQEFSIGSFSGSYSKSFAITHNFLTVFQLHREDVRLSMACSSATMAPASYKEIVNTPDGFVSFVFIR
ncbi:MAG: hypothetical protein AB7T49_16245 [Oligoflexales bacterium]